MVDWPEMQSLLEIEGEGDAEGDGAMMMEESVDTGVSTRGSDVPGLDMLSNKDTAHSMVVIKPLKMEEPALAPLPVLSSSAGHLSSENNMQTSQKHHMTVSGAFGGNYPLML